MKDPAFLFYSSDFLSGVSDLTMEERGQFITLLCLQHQKGHLSKKAVAIAVASVTQDVMSKFNVDNDGLYYNERLDIEIAKRREFSEKQRNRALDGWKKRKQREADALATANAPALPLEDENENEDINVNKIIDESFEIFWNEYDKKVGEKKKIKKKWDKLREAEREAIMLYIPEYKKSQPNKQYRKHPQTFLNNRSWEDELIFEKPKNNGQTDPNEDLRRFITD